MLYVYGQRAWAVAYLPYGFTRAYLLNKLIVHAFLILILSGSGLTGCTSSRHYEKISTTFLFLFNDFTPFHHEISLNIQLSDFSKHLVLGDSGNKHSLCGID